MKTIAEITKAGETETQEFKSAFNTDVIETAVAFANTRGGRILIGISDTGQPLAKQYGKEALRDYVNRIATATEPSIIPNAQRLEHEHGEIIVLSIPEFPLKPIATRGRCYRRSGSMTRQMTPSEIAEVHLHSTGQSMDALIVQGKTISDIDMDAVRTYMRRATDQGRRSFTETQDPKTVLRKLHLIKSDHEITRAAILLFGKEPQSPLSQAVVHAGRLREKIHIMDNDIIDGAIIDQVESTVDFIKKNLHVRFEITGEPQRKEIWDYPLPAIREAVINAICHRDYGHVSDIQIKIFDDAMQVWSPGFLPFNVTVADLFDPEHSSSPRNKLIAQVFYDIGLIERYGSGIHRILNACKEAKLPEPLFENFSGGFRIRFGLQERTDIRATEENTPHANGKANVPLNAPLNVPLKTRILEKLRANPGIQRKHLAAAFGVTEKTIGRNIAALVSEEEIEHRGSKKTGGYFTKDNSPKTP